MCPAVHCCLSTQAAAQANKTLLTAHLYSLSLYIQACSSSRLLVFTGEGLMLTTGYVAAQTGTTAVDDSNESRLSCSPRPSTSEVCWSTCLLYTVKAVLPALFCLYRHRQVTSAAMFSVAAGLHPGECVAWSASPVGTGIAAAIRSQCRSVFTMVDLTL